MKRLLAGTAAFLFLSAAGAKATDMPIKAAPVAAPAPFSWNGLYIGAHAGYGWADYDMRDNAPPTIIVAPNKLRGWLGGGQIGYNVQFARNWLLGGEFDFAAADLRGTGAFPGGALTTRGKIDFLGTARTRFGYVVDRTLVYATGGLAWAHVESTEFGGGAPVRLFDEHQWGWTIGGGVEWALDPRWSVKVEYLYADLGRTGLKNLAPAPAGEISRDLTLSTVRLGINYRFGAPSAAASMPVKAAALSDPWSGSYAGVHGGYGWSHMTFEFTPGIIGTPQPKGFFGGIQTGYNWRLAPNWLFGLEGDNSFGSLTNTAANQSVLAGTTRGKIDDLATVRARFGYLADRSLWYVTGGAAVGEVKATSVPTGFVFDVKSLQAGWTAGGGIECMIDPNWSAKVEYLYVDLGKNWDSIGPFGTRDVTVNTVKLGLNYHGSLFERFFGAR